MKVNRKTNYVRLQKEWASLDLVHFTRFSLPGLADGGSLDHLPGGAQDLPEDALIGPGDGPDTIGQVYGFVLQEGTACGKNSAADGLSCQDGLSLVGLHQPAAVTGLQSRTAGVPEELTPGQIGAPGLLLVEFCGGVGFRRFRKAHGRADGFQQLIFVEAAFAAAPEDEDSALLEELRHAGLESFGGCFFQAGDHQDPSFHQEKWLYHQQTF